MQQNATNFWRTSYNGKKAWNLLGKSRKKIMQQKAYILINIWDKNLVPKREKSHKEIS